MNVFRIFRLYLRQTGAFINFHLTFLVPFGHGVESQRRLHILIAKQQSIAHSLLIYTFPYRFQHPIFIVFTICYFSCHKPRLGFIFRLGIGKCRFYFIKCISVIVDWKRQWIHILLHFFHTPLLRRYSHYVNNRYQQYNQHFHYVQPSIHHHSIICFFN